MGYIYGIYADNVLIYIGKTMRSVETRFKEHRAAVYKGGDKQRIHSLIEDFLNGGIKVQMKTLYEVSDISDLKYLEDMLIFKHQPIGNVQGSITNRRKDYRGK